jgi:hypothetical protein
VLIWFFEDVSHHVCLNVHSAFTSCCLIYECLLTDYVIPCVCGCDIIYNLLEHFLQFCEIEVISSLLEGSVVVGPGVLASTSRSASVINVAHAYAGNVSSVTAANLSKFCHVNRVFFF